jgi:hypothetical protein
MGNLLLFNVLYNKKKDSISVFKIFKLLKKSIKPQSYLNLNLNSKFCFFVTQSVAK